MAIKKGQMTDNETGDLLYFQTSYDMVTDKPTNFPPSSHNHDDRYYTEAEMNTKLTAKLDTTGKVPSSQLPSYVDDVLEYTNKAGFPTTGESGKIYIDKATNITYRWSGTTYVEISPSLALGETSSTAYPGNKGKTTTDNVNAILAGTKIVPKATDANTLDGKDSTNFASAADLAKKLDKSGGTMEGVFNVDTLYFKVNTASGYRQAFGTIRGGLLALGSDELPAALYGYNKDQKPQWVYKEGSNYVFKDLALKDDIYPVGAIYMSVSPTSPASLFGGTWTQWGSGRVPIGINSSDSDFNTVEKTGGSKEYELRALIGAVGGNVNTIGYDSEAVVPGYGSYDMVLDASAGAKPQGASNTTRVVKSDGNPATTVQPYITCYMWKRVS